MARVRCLATLALSFTLVYLALTPTTLHAQAPTTFAAFSPAMVNMMARPAIVQINNNQTMTAGSGRFTSQTYVVPAGVGTGFIFDKAGFILTNNHVVAGAMSLSVVTQDGTTHPGRIVGTDPDGDLAVVKIDGLSDFPTVPFGDSSALVVGQPVVAIGNALALEGGPTVSAGIVSALNRTVQEPGSSSGGGSNGGGNGPSAGGTGGGASTGSSGNGGNGNAASQEEGPFLVGMVQTDAPINPGNSGGPLLDAAGNVIGINTLGQVTAEPGVPAQGVNFAIASNTARTTAQALMNGMPIVRPFLGAAVTPLSPLQDAQLSLPPDTGVLVAAVQSGSPADMGGLKQGDVIVQMDGTGITGQDSFPTLLLGHRPGDMVTLVVLRNDMQQNMTVTLGQRPTMPVS